MSLKKCVVPALAGLLTVFLLASPASAHGGRHHGGGRGYAAPQVSTVCPAGCDQTGCHSHQGVTYCGYHHASNTCNGYCAALCQAEGCTEPGRHTHDGSLLCGYAHEAGYCDGSCAAILAAQAVQNQFARTWTGCFGGHCGWHC